MLRQLLDDFEETAEQWPEDALETLWAEAAQQKLPLYEDERPGTRPERRVAVLEGNGIRKGAVPVAVPALGTEPGSGPGPAPG